MPAHAASLEDDIYECALLPDNWPKVLTALAEIPGARGGCLVSGDTRTLRRWTASESLETCLADCFETDAINKSARFGSVLAVGSAGFMIEDTRYTNKGAFKDPLYTDHLWPRGLGFSAGTAFRTPTGDVLIISFERDRDKGQVQLEARHKLDALRPHIARAAYLAARQELKRARDAVALLAQLGLPAIVFDHAAKVLAANDFVEPLTSHIIWRAGDRIMLKDRKAQTMLHQAIATIDNDDLPVVRSFIVRGAEVQGSLIAHVVPIRGSARDLLARCAAIMILTPVAMPAGPPVELIQSLFDMTPSEASVARKIAAGKTLDEIATGGGVTLNTVRTQAKGVLSKTGCRRQAEVAALLGNLGRSVAL